MQIRQARSRTKQRQQAMHAKRKGGQEKELRQARKGATAARKGTKTG